MLEVDPLDLVETVREGLLVLDADLTIRFATVSFATHLQSHQRMQSARNSMNSATDS